VPEAASDIWNRAISVRPAVVERVTPEDMNVVFQTLTLPADKQFDLVIGTNIFVYYASLEQSLARANIGSMVRPGGFLISNELLPSKAPSKLTDSLQTKVDVSTGDTEYMYTYARQK
jgi:chemotaxis methyl-accepting protein methylase